MVMQILPTKLLIALTLISACPASADNPIDLPKILQSIAQVEATAVATAVATLATQIQPISASVGSNALTLNLANTSLDFRSATLTSGAVNSAVATGALSLTVAAGATLGTVNTVQAQLAILVLYNAGTPVLAVVNMAGGVNLDETTLISSTALSGSSNSASSLSFSAC